MNEDFVIPSFAKNTLPGLTVKKVTEDAPHMFTLEFTDGSILVVTATPFKTPELDVTFVDNRDLPK